MFVYVCLLLKMVPYTGYDPEEEQGKEYLFYLDNQERRYGAALERLIEEEAPIKEVKEIWDKYRVIYKGNRGSSERYKELKKDYKDYKKYIRGELDTNPVKLKKSL